MKEEVFIFGCGYTGHWVRHLLHLDPGIRIRGTTRQGSTAEGLIPFDCNLPATDVDFVPRGARILYSIPDMPFWLLEAILNRAPARLVYLSSTGVYGRTREVNESTPAAPDRPEMQARLDIEQRVLDMPFSSIVLRPAAIYGPGRGVHRRLIDGTFRSGGQGSISRIHVEDLAQVCIQALFSCLTGAWPVADELACPSAEIVRFCVETMGLPEPRQEMSEAPHPTLRGDRVVDGSAIRKTFGLELKYPTYRHGIEADLRQERSG